MKNVKKRVALVLLAVMFAILSLSACSVPTPQETTTPTEQDAQSTQQTAPQESESEQQDTQVSQDPEPPEEIIDFTINVNEVIDIASRGPFVMGTIESGTINKGDTVKIFDKSGELIAESLSTDLLLLDGNVSVQSASEGEQVGVLFYHEMHGSLDMAHTMTRGMPLVEDDSDEDAQTVDYAALIEEVKARPGVTEFAASIASMSFKDDVYKTQLTLYEEDETKEDSKDRFTYQPDSKSGYTLTADQAEDVIILVDAVNGYKQIPMDEYYKYAGKNAYYTIFRYYMQDDELIMMAEVNFLNP